MKEPKYKEGDCATWPYDKFVRHEVGEILTGFIEGGGPGLKSAVRNMLLDYRYWLAAHDMLKSDLPGTDAYEKD